VWLAALVQIVMKTRRWTLVRLSAAAQTARKVGGRTAVWLAAIAQTAMKTGRWTLVRLSAAAQIARKVGGRTIVWLAAAAHTAMKIGGRTAVWLAAIAQTAMKTGRRTIVRLTTAAETSMTTDVQRLIGFGTAAAITVVCISLIALFSKPTVEWIESHRAALSFGDHTQSTEAAQIETDPTQQSTKAQPATGSPSAEDTPPRPLRIIPAEYTPAARYARFRGTIAVVVTVDQQGGASNPEFIAPIPFDLDARVRQVVPRWRFKPAMHDGHPVEGRTVVKVPFR
jgi:TonB family protein